MIISIRSDYSLLRFSVITRPSQKARTTPEQAGRMSDLRNKRVLVRILGPPLLERIATCIQNGFYRTAQRGLRFCFPLHVLHPPSLRLRQQGRRGLCPSLPNGMHALEKVLVRRIFLVALS